jgi:hypothetical protein
LSALKSNKGFFVQNGRSPRHACRRRGEQTEFVDC